MNPYMFTTTLAKLAEEQGARIKIAAATSINYKGNRESIESVSYTEDGTSHILEATDVLVSAGPWTPTILSQVHLQAPRGHSVIVRPSRDLSPYVLFPNIVAPPNRSLQDILLPEIYPGPADRLHGFYTVYASGPDDYSVPLPSLSDSVEVDSQSCENV